MSNAPARRRLFALLSAALWVVASLPATPVAIADPDEEGEGRVLEGLVVRTDGSETIIDLGSAQGLPTDAVVQLYRRVEVTHPATGEALVDRFPIGQAMVSELGSILSIVADTSALSRPPSVGDFVVYEPEARRGGMRLPRSQQDAASGPTAVDPERAAVEAAFERTLGRPLTERIAVWEGYLGEHPEGPYVETVAAELTWLRQQLAEARQAEARLAALPPPPPERVTGYVSVPPRARAGRPIDVAAAVVEREEVESVRLLARRAGQPGFLTIAMEPAGDYNWRAALEGDWERPGIVEYFVEVVRTNGDLQLLAGSAGRPRQIQVEEVDVDRVERRDRSKARLNVDFVDFNVGDDIDDHFLRFEAEYRYRIGAGLLNAFTMGMGIFQGQGGPLSDLHGGSPSQSRNVNYGFAEVEMAFARVVGASFRLSAGNAEPTGEERGLTDVLGGQLELRLGEEEGTRLEVGGALTEEIGNEAWTRLHIAAIRDWPMSAEVVVTDLPVGADLGVSLNYRLGWQALDWLAIAASTGLNARTINDFGFTGGVGTIFDW